MLPSTDVEAHVDRPLSECSIAFDALVLTLDRLTLPR
jgi:hypothetical protein